MNKYDINENIDEEGSLDVDVEIEENNIEDSDIEDNAYEQYMRNIQSYKRISVEREKELSKIILQKRNL